MDDKTMQGKVEINLVGKRVGVRVAILINRKQVLLTDASFRYLVGLIMGRIVNARSGGFISKHDADSDKDVREKDVHHAGYYYRMSQEITSGMGGRLKHWWPIYESDKTGNYRLRGDINFLFNWEYLEEYPDHRVQRMIARIKAKKEPGLVK